MSAIIPESWYFGPKPRGSEVILKVNSRVRGSYDLAFFPVDCKTARRPASPRPSAPIDAIVSRTYILQRCSEYPHLVARHDRKEGAVSFHFEKAHRLKPIYQFYPDRLLDCSLLRRPVRCVRRRSRENYHDSLHESVRKRIIGANAQHGGDCHRSLVTRLILRPL
jgi:hypothetical protein